MSRLTIKTKDDLPPEMHALWDKMTTYGAFENQAGVMAQRPPIFEHMWRLLINLADEAVLSKRHLEIGLVTVSLLNKCDYCVSHHAPKLAIQGVSQAGAERLLDVVARMRGASAREVVDAIFSEVETFRAGASPNDDMTAVALKITG